MTSNDFWATCIDCGSELKQEDNKCPKCGSTRRMLNMVITDGIVIRDGIGTKQRRKGFKRPITESVSNRFKKSGDPKLKDGVLEDMSIDRINDKYHQVVKDAKTGKIIHEEHESLSRHNNITKPK
jgi:hypothetical protein